MLVDSAAAVAQALRTRLALWAGEWFLDASEGTDYEARILGAGTQGTRDMAIRERILGTPGVREIVTYSSSVDSARKMTVSVLVDTPFGTASATLQV